jgi:hypothetical protein
MNKAARREFLNEPSPVGKFLCYLTWAVGWAWFIGAVIWFLGSLTNGPV